MQLYDVDDENSKLPVFLRDTEKISCPWRGKYFNTLAELQKTDLPVAFITDADENDVLI